MKWGTLNYKDGYSIPQNIDILGLLPSDCRSCSILVAFDLDPSLVWPCIREEYDMEHVNHRKHFARLATRKAWCEWMRKKVTKHELE